MHFLPELKVIHQNTEHKGSSPNFATSSLSLKLRWKNLLLHIGCPAAMAVKLKWHLEIHLYFSMHIFSCLWFDVMEMCFADKAKNMCFDWSNNCGDIFGCESVKFNLTVLKRNISPFKLWTNFNAHAQIYLTAKLPVILPNGNLPWGN